MGGLLQKSRRGGAGRSFHRVRPGRPAALQAAGLWAAVIKKPARTTLSWPQCRAATAAGRRFGDCLKARCAPAGKVIIQGVHTNSAGAASKRRAGGKGFLGAAFVKCGEFCGLELN